MIASPPLSRWVSIGENGDGINATLGDPRGFSTFAAPTSHASRFLSQFYVPALLRLARLLRRLALHPATGRLARGYYVSLPCRVRRLSRLTGSATLSENQYSRRNLAALRLEKPDNRAIFWRRINQSAAQAISDIGAHDLTIRCPRGAASG